MNGVLLHCLAVCSLLGKLVKPFFFFLLFVVFVVLLSSFDLVLFLQFLNLYTCMSVVPMFAVNI